MVPITGGGGPATCNLQNTIPCQGGGPGTCNLHAYIYIYIHQSKLPAANVPLQALKDWAQKMNYFLSKYVRHSLVYRDLVDPHSDIQ